MAGLTAVSAAAHTPTRGEIDRPARYTTGIVIVPASAEREGESSTPVPKTFVQAHTATKYRGGVVSLEEICESSPPRPRLTSTIVAASSLHMLCTSRVAKRRTAPSSVSPRTISAGPRALHARRPAHSRLRPAPCEPSDTVGDAGG